MTFLRSMMAAGLAVLMAVGPGAAATGVPAIGTLITKGAFRLNHATVRSNATLFDGAIVETGATPARVDLASGAGLELESESTARVFGRRLVLERGSAQVGLTPTNAGFLVEARGLTIRSDMSSAAARIALVGERRVDVSALGGSFRVFNSGGILVAKIAAGKALALELQSTSRPVRVTGRLVTRGGHYLLTDETTDVTVEVSASRSDLTKKLGQRVEIMGSARPDAIPAGGTVQLIQVAQVTPAPQPPSSAPTGSSGSGGTAPAGAGGPAAGAGGASGGAATGGVISVTMIAIIGGVAVAAVVGGLAATGGLGGSTAAPLSR